MSNLLPGLSAYVIVHNAIKGDYPVLECAESLLRADEVVLCDCDSTDGTLPMLVRWATTRPKVRVISVPWPKLPTYEEWKADTPRPLNDAMFWPKLINEVRPFLRYRHQLHLDADEVVFPGAWPEIHIAVESGTCRYLRRLNFWRDAHSLVPDGWVCGTYVAKLGPSELWMPSDEMHPEGEPEMRLRATKHDSLLIGHYGFLRRQDGFFEKSKILQTAIVGNYDSRLEEAERTGADWWTISNFPAELVPYEGRHPDCIMQFLNERGRL